MATQKDFKVKNGLIVGGGDVSVSSGSISISDQISGDTGQITISNGQFGDSFMRIGIIGGGTANSHIRTDSTLEFHRDQSATSTTPSFSIGTDNSATFAGTISSGNIDIGTADTTNGVLTIHGGGTGNVEGGEIRLGLSADHDSTYDFYRIDTINDVFRIGRSGTTDITLDSSGNTTFEGSVTSSSGGFTATIGGIHVADGVTFGQPDHFLGDEGGQNDSETLLLRNGASASGNSGIKILAGYNDGGDTSGKIQLYTNGSTSSPKLEIDIDGNIKMGSTQIISGGSRNLTNIGTINSGAISSSQNININASGTNDTRLEVGAGTSSNHYSYIDLIGDSTYADYGLRIIRNNGGANTNSQIVHRGTGNFSIQATDSASIKIRTASQDALTIDSSQNATFAGTISSGAITANHSKSSTANPVLTLKNTSTTNEGRYIQFNDNAGVNIGQIGHVDQTESNIFISTFDTGLKFESYITYKAILPCGTDGADVDNIIDLGSSSVRFDDIYATNGTIQTSDRNEKQDIQALTDAEQRVATACKALIRRFRWQDSVAEKDDNPDSDETARYHFGVIAQDLQDAFEAEGLDAGDYGMFISSTWTDDNGNEQTRLGVRYNELLAFIITTL
jgi:hypothetical protein